MYWACQSWQDSLESLLLKRFFHAAAIEGKFLKEEEVSWEEYNQLRLLQPKGHKVIELLQRKLPVI